ncbi:MAG: sigma-70 family RNA polymerase sigma factor [Acidimicrobiia bacterium]
MTATAEHQWVISSSQFEELYRSEGPRLVGLARLLTRNPATAEELVQDVFERALRRRGASIDEPRAFLRQMVVNACRDAGRRKARGQRIGGRFNVVGPTSTAGADVEAEGSETKRRLRAAVDELPSPRREAVILRYFSQCSITEVAETLGLPEGTVRSHLHRAMGQLEVLIGDLR